VIEIIKLLAVFGLLVLSLKLTKQLSIAVGIAAAAAAFLFRLGLPQAFIIAGKAVISPLTVSTVLAFYFITFMQRLLEKRGKLTRAQECLNGIFNNRRVNASLAPILMGMLPSAAVVTIAGAMVDAASEDSLTVEEKTFVATYYRHVSEAFLPTYPGILIAAQLAGVALSTYLLGMLPVLAVIIGAGFVFYLRKVPKETGNPPSRNRLKDLGSLFVNLWPLFVIVFLVICFPVPVYLTVFLVIVADIFIDRFKWAELKPMFRSAFEVKLILSTVMIMIFKDFIIASGVISSLPSFFSRLPIPSYMIYMLIVFFGTLISGQQAINVVVLPMAFAAGAAGGAGAPLFILLMTSGYCAMQISPTHICLAIVTEYFKTSMGSLVKKTLPVILSVIGLSTLYYLLLRNFV
jgi:integral membrane protein (TIGR00529 family)